MDVNVKFGGEASEELLRGIDLVADAVKTTLGAGGRTVAIDRGHGNLQITKDGVTVALSMQKDSDPVVNMGMQLVKSVANKTVEEAGDGTTTASVLTQILVKEGYKFIKAGVNPTKMKVGMEKAVKKVVEYLKDLALPVGEDLEILRNIATISANNDPEIGALIAGAMEQIGKNGIITVEESKSSETTIEMTTGFQYQAGYVSPYFINTLQGMKAIYNDVAVLIVEETMALPDTYSPIFDTVARTRKPLLILAENYSPEMLNFLIANRMKGALQVVATKLPSYGELRAQITEDISIATSAVRYGGKTGVPVDEVSTEGLGFAERVECGKNSTIIVRGGGNEQSIADRVTEIEAAIEVADNKYDIEKLQERLARFTGGAAVISIGGQSEVEMKEKKDRVDDALAATRAAIEEGIVPGGGSAFLGAKINSEESVSKEGDEWIGYNLVMSALMAPALQIAANAGYGSLPVEKVQEVMCGEDNANKWYGFDAKENRYGNMREFGIIDPVKVCRVALENAVSVASMILSTNCVISVVPENQKGENCKC
jgi:chaperonin GroEL